MTPRELFEHHYGLVGWFTNKTIKTNPKLRIHEQDLFQEVALGLWAACNSHKGNKSQMSTWASWKIKGQVSKFYTKMRAALTEEPTDIDDDMQPEYIVEREFDPFEFQPLLQEHYDKIFFRLKGTPEQRRGYIKVWRMYKAGKTFRALGLHFSRSYEWVRKIVDRVDQISEKLIAESL